MSVVSERPNVLIFIPHDLGDHLGCYGHATVESPRLDRLGEEGVRFTSYFNTAPECTCSRGSMMTGLYAHQNGLMGLATWGWELNESAIHLARRMADGGYRTHLFGFQHETAGPPERLGYGHVHTGPERESLRAGNVCEDVARFLGGEDARNGGPWLACAGFKDMHRPWPEESTFDPDAVEVPPYLPDNETIRRDVARLHQNILDMDTAVGRALDALRDNGLDKNTLVLFTTDHGIGFPHAKATFYDPGIHIPLLARWPDGLPAGRTVEALLSNVDFTPTVLDLCGCPAPDGLAGRSFAPLLRGEPYEERDAVFGSVLYDVSYDPMHFVRTRTHKYIRSFAATPEEAAGADPEVLCTFRGGRWVRLDDADVMSRESWRIMDKSYPPPPPEELYGLEADPVEMDDIAGRPASAGILDDMRRRMRDFMERTDSPLLSGHVPPPDIQKERRAAHVKRLFGEEAK
jgi:arylsulfatase A-like enzyme